MRQVTQESLQGVISMADTVVINFRLLGARHARTFTRY